jgi:23S rRNA (adenine2503-C2)-methyltransferase
LSARFLIACPQTLETFQSSDGTQRYLFEVAGGHRIEFVFIPEEKRDTLCISTQVGYAGECLFCVTGKLPMRRNFTACEIVDCRRVIMFSSICQPCEGHHACSHSGC